MNEFAKIREFVKHLDSWLFEHQNNLQDYYGQDWTLTFVDGSSVKIPFGAPSVNHLLDALQDIADEEE